jgi:hypothetical protein
MTKASISKAINEIKEKYANHIDSGYILLIERDKLPETAAKLANAELGERSWANQFMWCVSTFSFKPTASHVLSFDFRGHYNISKTQQDAITAFLRKKGFQCHHSVGTYFI